MNINFHVYIKEKHYKYIANGRKAAIIVNEERHIIGDSHKDCLEFLYFELEDKELDELENNVYNHDSDLPMVLGDVFEEAVVLYYHKHIKNIKINELLNEYCLKTNKKIFLDNSSCHK